MTRKLDHALRLHLYLASRHWADTRLTGPDSGLRFNRLIGRFIKSYLRWLPWRDDLYYLQAQAYWTLANWRLSNLVGDERFGDIAVACSSRMVDEQRDDGAWEYPNPAWRGRVATAEGTWAALALLETERRSLTRRFLSAALRWHGYVEREVGFQPALDGIAVNYFAGRPSMPIPNNTAFYLRFLAELAAMTEDERYLARCPELVAFMADAQTPRGELPYEVSRGPEDRPREHFVCYQYNAFQCLDLLRYVEISDDRQAREIVGRLLPFLTSGLTPEGYSRYDCHKAYPRIAFHVGVLAAAFAQAEVAGFPGYRAHADRAYGRLIRLQQKDGGYPFSQGDYRILSDRRSYPRSLAMILYHLLSPVEFSDAHGTGQHARAVS